MQRYSLSLSSKFGLPRPRKIAPAIGLTILLLTSGACASQAVSPRRTAPAAPLPLADIAGSWQDEEDPQYFVGIEDSSWTLASDGRVQSVSRFLARKGSQVHLCQGGWRTVREVHLDKDGTLTVTDLQPLRARRLRRLPAKPSALAVVPLSLGEPVPLPPARVAEIQHQLWERSGRSQDRRGVAPPREAFLADPVSEEAPPAPFSLAELGQIDRWTQAVDYLKAVVTEVGWIDVERFGYAAANAAFSIAHHSSDLPLMLAALPGVRKDALSNQTDREDYGLLFDRVQLTLGKKQRYGTQIGFDSARRAFVLSIEDPGGVDQRRESLGMMPLPDYVRAVARFNNVSAPPEVLFSEECADP